MFSIGIFYYEIIEDKGKRKEKSCDLVLEIRIGTKMCTVIYFMNK